MYINRSYRLPIMLLLPMSHSLKFQRFKPYGKNKKKIKNLDICPKLVYPMYLMGQKLVWTYTFLPTLPTYSISLNILKIRVWTFKDLVRIELVSN